MPCCTSKNHSKKQTCDLFLFCTQTALCSDMVRQQNLGFLPIIFFPYQDLSDLNSAELNKRLLVVPVTQAMGRVPPAFIWAKFCTSQKFEHLFQDATKIFSLTQPCHQQSLLHKQTTSKFSCILPQNTQEKLETYFICIFTSMNWNREKPNLLYAVKTDWQSPCSKPSPEPGKVPKTDSCIQVAGSHQQASAERRTCFVNGWFPGCQIAAVSWPLRTKHRQGKAWTAWPWVSSTLIWGSPPTLQKAWDSGKPCALEGNSKITCVHWKSRDCIFFLNYFLKVLSNCTSSVSSCSMHFWKMFYKTDIL